MSLLIANLHDVLAMLASDPTKETTALKQQLDLIQPNDVIDKSEISIIENIFFNYDSVFMPWVWKVCEGSWSLKEFVSNL
ncbi:16511_t:CDS:2, partial [Racocetra fulgida]